MLAFYDFSSKNKVIKKPLALNYHYQLIIDADNLCTALNRIRAYLQDGLYLMYSQYIRSNHDFFF